MEVTAKIPKVYEPIFYTDARYIVLIGGRGAGRSGTAVRFACLSLLSDQKENIMFMRYFSSDIKDSLHKDFTSLVQDWELPIQVPERISTPIKYLDNQIICKGFRKADSAKESKLKSLSGVTKVIIEEADEVGEDEFMKLDDSLRTVAGGKLQIVLCLNPPQKEHWILKRWFDLVPYPDGHELAGFFDIVPKKDPNLCAVVANYTANLANLDSTTVANFEGYKQTNPYYYRTQILGKVPALFDKVYYTNYTYADDFPTNQDLTTVWGLDFGYYPDPTALVKTQYQNAKIWVQERVYDTELSNEQIAARMTEAGVGKVLVVADNAEPKTIAYLQQAGFNIIECIKGAGSVETGIKDLQSLQLILVGENANIKAELEEYRPNPKTGAPTGKHHALDAIRYVNHYRLYSNAVQPSTQLTNKRKTAYEIKKHRRR